MLAHIIVGDNKVATISAGALAPAKARSVLLSGDLKTLDSLPAGRQAAFPPEDGSVRFLADTGMTLLKKA